jgi:hypothetical protein
MDKLAARIMLADNIVAIAEATARPALSDPALLAPPNLLCEVLEEERRN